MTPAERIAGERWEEGKDGTVVVAGSRPAFVAVVGVPEVVVTPEDRARLALIIAAPDMLAALDELMAPLRAALTDGVQVDPNDLRGAMQRAGAAMRRARARVLMDHPFDGRGTGA